MIAVVGAGAAGLATAIFAVRRGVRGPIVVFDGARRPGAKILVSGGTRCNLTNAMVTEADYGGSPRHLVRRVLRGFGVAETVAFFREIGVTLREERDGKLFPVEGGSRAVLGALLAEAERLGVTLRAGERVVSIDPDREGFRLRTSLGTAAARRLVLATGGLSLPKTGSDGEGLGLAAALGHSVVPTTPALVPLVLAGSFHVPLSGVSHQATLTVREEGRARVRRTGSLLWTHFGLSGPVVLDVSRYWLRGRAAGERPTLEANLVPALDFDSAERTLLDLAAGRPHLSLARALEGWLPGAVAEAIAGELDIPPATALGGLRREQRRACVRGVVARELPVVGSRGYSFAEATAGGVPLAELDTRTMASRRRRGLFLTGEMLDVDGRVGGFNFQWAWSSAWVAAGGLTE